MTNNVLTPSQTTTNNILTFSQTTNVELFESEKVCRGQF